ncbi:MAG: hypothetical protein EXR31_08945 [Betaproteobacteria bacterium]|nr:hypothetical protein [Betaproteobacteria bacterium]
MPSIVVVTERFVSLAKSTGRTQGIPEAPMIILPRSEDVEYSGPAAMETAAETTLRGFLAEFMEDAAA